MLSKTFTLKYVENYFLLGGVPTTFLTKQNHETNTRSLSRTLVDILLCNQKINLNSMVLLVVEVKCENVIQTTKLSLKMFVCVCYYARVDATRCWNKGLK